MEGDEMEMSKGELQKWIREKVKKNGQISTDVLEKSNLLQSLLERREKQAAHLLKLCESVAACEALVKEQYSLLGWEYRDTDSDDDDDDDDNITGSGNTPPSPCLPTTTDPTPLLPKLEDSENLNGDNGKKSSISLKRKPVVVLTRLTKCMISSLRLQTPQNHYSEDESLNNSDSDEQWKPEGDSSDSDCSTSSYKTGSNKKRKIEQKNGKKMKKSHATPQASTKTDAKSNAAKASTPQANAKCNITKASTPQANAKCNITKASTPQANGNTNAKGKAMKTSPSANTNVSALCQTSDKAKTKTPPSVPQGEISVNMNVLARKKDMSWKRGKVMEIVTKEDGRLKYKINFEEKGKSLVSGHHIAFDCMPRPKQLCIGARVVVKSQADQSQFFPGVLAELPSRKNRMRFLVFIDDHTPVYVGLPLLNLVFRPLRDPLDDIPDGAHKNFMKEYIKAWPYPPQTQYMVGQTINAEFNGAQQRCEVQVVDCSLIQVVFQNDQHKEWIYRGSMRLEHMINMREHLDLKKEEEQ